MTTQELHMTVGQLVTERPARARVFESFGIDFCCGGKKLLATACAEKGIAVERLLAALEACDCDTAAPERDWSAAPLTDLADHIVDTHHAYLRAELPRLAAMVDKVTAVHAAHHRELNELRRIYHAFRSELESHMFKEERILFPMIRQLESVGALPDFHCGTVRNPIRIMEHEHEDAGQALSRMRELTNNYSPPEGACNTYRAMLHSLAELESDMHRHVHKENNILFPRAARTEDGRSLRPGP